MSMQRYTDGYSLYFVGVTESLRSKMKALTINVPPTVRLSKLLQRSTYLTSLHASCAPLAPEWFEYSWTLTTLRT